MSALSRASQRLVITVLATAVAMGTAACADEYGAQPTMEQLLDAALAEAVLDGGSAIFVGTVEASMEAPVDASVSPQLDATLVLTPSSLPDGSCRGDRANEQIWHLSSAADQACEKTSDCVVLTPRTSCSSVCGPVAVSGLGAMQLGQALSQLEQGVCAELPDNRPCLYDDPVACTLLPYQPRCHAGHCSHTPLGCPLEQVEQLEGMECSAPGKECLNPGFCPLGVRCSDEDEPGVYRWVLQILLC